MFIHSYNMFIHSYNMFIHSYNMFIHSYNMFIHYNKKVKDSCSKITQHLKTINKNYTYLCLFLVSVYTVVSLFTHSN